MTYPLTASSMRSTQKMQDLQKTKKCPACNGKGWNWVGTGAKITCLTCGGSGIIVVSKVGKVEQN